MDFSVHFIKFLGDVLCSSIRKENKLLLGLLELNMEIILSCRPDADNCSDKAQNNTF